MDAVYIDPSCKATGRNAEKFCNDNMMYLTEFNTSVSLVWIEDMKMLQAALPVADPWFYSAGRYAITSGGRETDV